MAKKVIYDYKSRYDLFFEHLAEKNPDVRDIQKLVMLLNDQQRETMFKEICNKYGESGWHIHPIPFRNGDRWFYQFSKEVYISKNDQLKIFIDKISTWAKGVGHSDQNGIRVIRVDKLKAKMDQLSGRGGE